MNAFKNHTQVPVLPTPTEALIASLAIELQAAEQIITEMHRVTHTTQRLAFLHELSKRGVVEDEALRTSERKAVLALAKAFQAPSPEAQVAELRHANETAEGAVRTAVGAVKSAIEHLHSLQRQSMRYAAISLRDSELAQ